MIGSHGNYESEECLKNGQELDLKLHLFQALVLVHYEWQALVEECVRTLHCCFMVAEREVVLVRWLEWKLWRNFSKSVCVIEYPSFNVHRMAQCDDNNGTQVPRN